MTEYLLIYREGLKKRLEEYRETGRLTMNDLLVLGEWAKQMRTRGPEHIRKTRRWRDFVEKDGKYAGYRSSSLGTLEKRVIYGVEEGKVVIVEVVAVDTSYYTGEKNERK